MKVTEGGPHAAEQLLVMLDEHSSWLVPVQYVNLMATLEWEEHPRPPIVKQILSHARDGQIRICRNRLGRPMGGSVLTGTAPEFVPRAEEPELYLHFLVTGREEARRSGIEALVTDARAEAARRGVRLLRTHCWAGEDGRLVREYEELGFTATLEFEELRSDGSYWPGRILQTRV
ncbi:GNAT family N-acetyltransferase [Streptomyces smaragdinus]|nr:GNAT family N-acetyltransferase [Streptomyces smaragdinus]